MRLCADWNGLGGGRVGDCGCDGADEGGNEGGKDRWVYAVYRVCIIVAVFFVLSTPGYAAAHTIGFVAS